MITYNLINYKRLCVIIMHFFRIILFHVRRHFHASPSVRVFGSGQSITYSRHFCTNNTSHKIYHCMPAGSTLHYILLRNPTIIRIKTFFTPACHPHKKNRPRQNCHILHCYTHARFARNCPILNDIQK